MSNKENDCTAVIACRKGHGVVLWYIGPSLANEIEEIGLYLLSDLGLDDAPDGISIWTGRYITTGGPAIPSYCDDSLETNPKGSFRQPSADEWNSIMAGISPWPNKEA